MSIESLFDGQDMTGLAASIRDGDVSAREVVEFALHRIAERNPAVNAVVAERAEEALAEVDAGLPDGPLRGIPFLIKDLHADVAGLPTSNGSRLFADRVANADTELVSRYRRAGLVVIGKTNTPEFGQNASTEPVLFGPTRNPRRLTHSVGGSSGGAGAAVAVGIAPAAHASDGGGSIRIPASANGLVGLKPSRGRMPSGAPLSVRCRWNTLSPRVFGTPRCCSISRRARQWARRSGSRRPFARTSTRWVPIRASFASASPRRCRAGIRSTRIVRRSHPTSE